MNPETDAQRLSAEPDKRSGSPDSYQTALKLAFEMHQAGRNAEAEALCRELQKNHPQDGQLLFLLGMILHKVGRDAEAIQCLTQAAEFEPNSARIFCGLGCAYKSSNDPERACVAFARALELEPRSTITGYNFGNTCYQLGQVDRAAALFRTAVEVDPRDFACWNNLGMCLKELNRLDESIEAYNRSLEISPEYGFARYGRAIALLLGARLEEGFREYEWRWRSRTPRKFPQPKWTGEPASGKTLFLHAEQGFGDAIQMARFIPAMREKFARVIFECRPELQTLFAYSQCADEIVPAGAAIPPFDYFLPMGSLPAALHVTLDTIPKAVPYLRVPHGKRLAAAPAGKMKVGLAWAGNPDHHQDAARSIPLANFAPILHVPGVKFYSLQYAVPARDQAYLESVSEVLDSTVRFADFLDTASFVAELDLVISVDTGVAHLAGALRKPVWTLLQHSPDWRWFLERTDTPWYPTMRLWRQAERNQWASPIRRVAEALRGMAGE